MLEPLAGEANVSLPGLPRASSINSVTLEAGNPGAATMRLAHRLPSRSRPKQILPSVL